MRGSRFLPPAQLIGLLALVELPSYVSLDSGMKSEGNRQTVNGKGFL